MGAVLERTPENQVFFAKRFALWLGIASMTMMFAGFTSAYIVKKADTSDWANFPIPSIFFISTVLILLSSLTMHLSRRSFNKDDVIGYRKYLLLTLILGTGFLVSQIIGWRQLVDEGILLQTQVSGAFFYVISGTHALHVLGGIVILLISLFRINRKIKDPVYDLTMAVSPIRKFRVDLVNTYWHFVDVLWIYLFLFLLYNHS